MTDGNSERGIALLLALLALLLMSALGVAVTLTSASETVIAAHFRDAIGARYAAEALLARGFDDVSGAGDWNLLIDGTVRSTWVDGPPFGRRTLSDGSAIDLTQVANLANCAKITACSRSDMDAVTADRPWAGRNPRWTPYAYGAVRDLLPGSRRIESPYYVLLLVGSAPAAARLAMRAEAFGPRGAHAVVEAVVEKDYNGVPVIGTVTVLCWREVR